MRLIKRIASIILLLSITLADNAVVADSASVYPVSLTHSLPYEFTLATGQLNSNRTGTDSRFDYYAGGNTVYVYTPMPNLPNNIPGWSTPTSPGNGYHCPNGYYAYIVPALVDSRAPNSSGASSNLSGSIDFCSTTSSPHGSLAYVAYGHVVNNSTTSGADSRAYINFTVTCILCAPTGCPAITGNPCRDNYGWYSNDSIVQPPHS